jgi:hypothetical protein
MQHKLEHAARMYAAGHVVIGVWASLVGSDRSTFALLGSISAAVLATIHVSTHNTTFDFPLIAHEPGKHFVYAVCTLLAVVGVFMPRSGGGAVVASKAKAD